ncbi:hypothetical protein GNI_021500 [Gregarina niphandrodes]|uniref:Uncharacterized protein n=1 Tax=Gregarina niphandrodes TaxID=110365 RepID=A0A023BBQ2_GRENI|nr:hypothetical protein GNI_021500 [Gregarina niphandrodes]EZG80491.1 hypothetical protein GNI_021500 [Gregarina niphandrodes]|eukprot:XP_011134297.1 hypothetical protein GNI_021500 [Gregarina niphandrodes]
MRICKSLNQPVSQWCVMLSGFGHQETQLAPVSSGGGRTVCEIGDTIAQGVVYEIAGEVGHGIVQQLNYELPGEGPYFHQVVEEGAEQDVDRGVEDGGGSIVNLLESFKGELRFDKSRERQPDFRSCRESCFKFAELMFAKTNASELAKLLGLYQSLLADSGVIVPSGISNLWYLACVFDAHGSEESIGRWLDCLGIDSTELSGERVSYDSGRDGEEPKGLLFDLLNPFGSELRSLPATHPVVLKGIMDWLRCTLGRKKPAHKTRRSNHLAWRWAWSSDRIYDYLGSDSLHELLGKCETVMERSDVTDKWYFGRLMQEYCTIPSCRHWLAALGIAVDEASASRLPLYEDNTGRYYTGVPEVTEAERRNISIVSALIHMVQTEILPPSSFHTLDEFGVRLTVSIYNTLGKDLFARMVKAIREILPSKPLSDPCLLGCVLSSLNSRRRSELRCHCARTGLWYQNECWKNRFSVAEAREHFFRYLPATSDFFKQQ